MFNFIMIDSAFLDVKFTEITLLHILILLGIPYIVFYLFERFTKFDKFIEKWEGALFVFVSGGIITLLSITLKQLVNIPFWYSYGFFLIFLILTLVIIKLAFFNHKKETSEKWVLIKLKNGDRFKGIIASSNPYFIKIRRNNLNKIVKLDKKNKEKEIDWKNIQFNMSEVLGIYSL